MTEPIPFPIPERERAARRAQRIHAAEQRRAELRSTMQQIAWEQHAWRTAPAWSAADLGSMSAALAGLFAPTPVPISVIVDPVAPPTQAYTRATTYERLATTAAITGSVSTTRVTARVARIHGLDARSYDEVATTIFPGGCSACIGSQAQLAYNPDRHLWTWSRNSTHSTAHGGANLCTSCRLMHDAAQATRRMLAGPTTPDELHTLLAAIPHRFHVDHPPTPR